MRSLFAVIRSLTLPAGAIPGQPRIVLGSDIPTELTTFYNVGLASITSVILWYYGNATNTYHYYGVVDLGGGAPPGNVVRGDVLAGTVFPLDIYVGNDYFIKRTAQLTASLILTGPSFTVDGFEQGRGMRDFVASTAVVGPFGAETTLLTSNSVTFVNGRAYSIRWSCDPAGSAAVMEAQFRIRRTNLAGAVVEAVMAFRCSATIGNTIRAEGSSIVKNSSGANITDVVLLTCAGNGGNVTTGAVATRPTKMEVRDIGTDSQYAAAAQI